MRSAIVLLMVWLVALALPFGVHAADPQATDMLQVGTAPEGTARDAPAADRDRLDDPATGAAHAAAQVLLPVTPGPVPDAPRLEEAERGGVRALADRWAGDLLGFFIDLAAFAIGAPAESDGSSTQAATAEVVGEETPGAVLGTVAAFGLLTLLGIWARRMGFLAWLPLFSRIEGSDLLKHPLRADIMAYVGANPGANTSEVARDLGAAWGTTTHHLGKLEASGLLVLRRVNNQKCYFTAGAVDRRAMVIRSALKRETAARVATYVQAHPQTSQKQMAEALGLSRAVTSFHVRKLVDQGVLTRERVGKEVRLCTVALAEEELRLAADTMVPGSSVGAPATPA